MEHGHCPRHQSQKQVPHTTRKQYRVSQWVFVLEAGGLVLGSIEQKSGGETGGT